MLRARSRRRQGLGRLLVAALLGCTAPAAYYVAPGHEGAPGVRRVLLCAPNLALALPAEITSGVEPVQRELTACLEGRGLEVAHLSLGEGRRRWEQAGAQVDQQGSAGSANETAAVFVKDMAQRREFDALIMPSLILRSVRVTDSSGTWDGVRRRLDQVNAPSMGSAGTTDTFTKGLAYGGVTGDIMAASLHVVVFSPDGQRVFEGCGGLDFIQEADLMDVRSWRWDLRMKRNPLGNPEVVREGVEIALAPYLTPRSEP